LDVVAVVEAFVVAVTAAAAAEVLLFDGVADFAFYCCCPVEETVDYVGKSSELVGGDD